MSDFPTTPGAWDCTAVGLTYSTGDAASITIGGVATGSGTAPAQATALNAVTRSGPATGAGPEASPESTPAGHRSPSDFDRFEPFWKAPYRY